MLNLPAREEAPDGAVEAADDGGSGVNGANAHEAAAVADEAAAEPAAAANDDDEDDDANGVNARIQPNREVDVVADQNADRFVDDMTWQRLVGLDGTLAFLENVNFVLHLFRKIVHNNACRFFGFFH